MKKKLVRIGIALILAAVVVFFGVRSIVGWRPFENFKYDDLNPYSLIVQIDLDEMRREYVQMTNMYHFIKLLNGMRVTPYDGEYDPWSMKYFVYRENNEGATYSRIGVALNPIPLVDINGKVYHLDRKSAERYMDFWENHSKAGYFKVGE